MDSESVQTSTIADSVWSETGLISLYCSFHADEADFE